MAAIAELEQRIAEVEIAITAEEAAAHLGTALAFRAKLAFLRWQDAGGWTPNTIHPRHGPRWAALVGGLEPSSAASV